MPTFRTIFLPRYLNYSPQTVTNVQGAFQIFSFFAIFHYRKLTKRHWRQINHNPDIFLCYIGKISTVRKNLQFSFKEFLLWLWLFLFIFLLFSLGENDNDDDIFLANCKFKIDNKKPFSQSFLAVFFIKWIFELF